MEKKELHGMGVALVTPFDATGAVDHEALARLVDYQVASRTDFLCVLGTTAETPTLSDEEQLAVRKTVVERNAGRLPILLGCGGNCTHKIVSKLAKDKMEDVDALLSVVPYYNKPSQEGMYQHFAAIAKASPVPVILYNVPGRVGVNMTAETTLRIAHEFENVVAIKEASGNLSQMEAIIKDKPKHFEVISGDDGLAFPLITLGGAGVISVIGNAFPKEFGRLVRLTLAGDYDNARSIHHQFLDLFDLLFVDGNPAGIKCMLNAMGYIENKLRLPLVPTRLTTYEKIRQVLDQLGIKK